MRGNQQALEDEFSILYDFLSDELPGHFNKGALRGDFCVNPNIDDEPVASMLMHVDQFNEEIPCVIQKFLSKLKFNWIVVGSFDIYDPISQDGIVTRSPSFLVDKSGSRGYLLKSELIKDWGSRLKPVGAP